jgi:HlyD family type I secretion membrane fusion protein
MSTSTLEDNPPSVPENPKPAILAGLLVIGLFFGVLGTWAALASMAGAAIAPGFIKVEGNRQSVQHRYGGIVKQILVKDGDRVQQNQLLLRLEDSEIRAKLGSLAAMRDSHKALEARLIAERDGTKAPVFDESLAAHKNDAAVANAMANQVALFKNRAHQFESEIRILKQRISQLREQIGGSRTQAESAERQQVLIEDELEGTRKLYAKGYSTKTKVLALERALEELKSTSGAKRAEIAGYEKAIGEAEIEIRKSEQARLTEVTDQLRDAQTKLAEIAPQLEDARDRLARTALRAPAAGIVVGLAIFTEGGVIEPGGRVLDIVPADDDLVVEAHVRPEDVHDVREGAPAEIRLTGMLGRLRPSMMGKVITVSADRFNEPKSGIAYYTAQIKTDPASVKASGVTLQPGMPADTLVTTKERSVLEYLISPLSDQLAKGFREE